MRSAPGKAAIEWCFRYLNSSKTAIELASFATAGWIIIFGELRDIGNAVISVYKTVTDTINEVVRAIAKLPSNLPIIGAAGGGNFNLGFQEGGSFIVPGSGSGDRPYVINLEPGELVNITPKNQVNITQNNTFMGGGGNALSYNLLNSLVNQ